MLKKYMQNILDIRAKHRGRLFFLPLIVTIIIIGGMVACSNRTQSYNTNSGQDDIRAKLSEITVDDLDLTVNPGVEVKIDFENADLIIFHGDFGLFGYDLNKQEIIFSVDFIKAAGIEGSVQGSRGTAVDVSGDGETIIISYYDVEKDIRGMACYINVPTLTYIYGEYRPLESTFQSDSTRGYIRTGLEIGTLRYIRDDKEWLLFN